MSVTGRKIINAALWDMRSFFVKGKAPKALEDYVKIQKALLDTQLALGDAGRVLLRPSGTEPVVRVMIEGQDAGQVQTLVTQLANVVEAELLQL